MKKGQKTLPVRVPLSTGVHADFEITTEVTVTGKVTEKGNLTVEERSELMRVIQGHIHYALKRALEG